jgi:hypothetical protein
LNLTESWNPEAVFDGRGIFPSYFHFLSLIWIYILLFSWVNHNISHCFSLNYSYKSLSINITPWAENKDFCFSLNYSYRSLSINTTPWAEHKDFCFSLNYSYRSLSIITTPWAEHKDFCFRMKKNLVCSLLNSLF